MWKYCVLSRHHWFDLFIPESWPYTKIFFIALQALSPGTAVPLLISSPYKNARRNEVTYHMTNLLDIAPTVLDWFQLLNSTSPTFGSGKSLMPLLKKAMPETPISAKKWTRLVFHGNASSNYHRWTEMRKILFEIFYKSIQFKVKFILAKQDRIFTASYPTNKNG
ncbi:unnamed protein product [Nesidiocoris tenuis]|uniref:Uncharacterized protein n=1 Tax=Nesidiocoris tenuis TaxID=355587 RepID=A0A6H5GAF6_9HEMI|nr:unnamed protein product [Nesidiocoris tenuis]